MCFSNKEKESRNNEYELQSRPRRSEGRRGKRTAGVPTGSSADYAYTSSSQAGRERSHTGINTATGNIHTLPEVPLPRREVVKDDQYYTTQARMRSNMEMEDMYFEDVRVHGAVKEKKQVNVPVRNKRRGKVKTVNLYASLPENPTDYNRAAYPRGAEGASRSGSLRTAGTESSDERTQAGPSRRNTGVTGGSKSSSKGKGTAKC